MHDAFVHLWWVEGGKVVPYQQRTDTLGIARVMGTTCGDGPWGLSPRDSNPSAWVVTLHTAGAPEGSGWACHWRT